MGGRNVEIENKEDEIAVDEDEREVGDADDEEGHDEYKKEERQKKKKMRKREIEKNYVLDEEDFELLWDNCITGLHRPKLGNKKFKRLKKAWKDTEQDLSGFLDGEELDKTGSGWTAEEKLKRNLFAPPLEDISEEKEQPDDGDTSDEDEMADFIVDEELDENRDPVRWRKPNRKKLRQTPGVSSFEQQEFYSIFGYVDESLMLRKQALAKLDKFDREKRLEDASKIRSIQKNRVFLQPRRKNELRQRSQHPQNSDPYDHEDQSNLQSAHEKAFKEKELAKKHLKRRMIVHPRFQNITADEAMEFLSDKDTGESIIRPSSRGPSYLTLTLKVYDGVYAHKYIIEGGKDHNNITNMLQLGKTLKIGEDTFEDLDEVMDRYVDPLVTCLNTMLSYRKFKRGSKADIDDLLRVEKSEYPMKIVYCFGISHEHPGTFILSYIRNKTPHHESIGLYPNGYKFRTKMFKDIDRLVASFQKYINDLPNDSAPSIGSVAAMVPMKTPATWGSLGASVGSGWGGSTANSNDSGWRSVGSGWGSWGGSTANSGWGSVGSGWGGSKANSNDSGWRSVGSGWGGSTANSNDSGRRSVGSGWGSWGGSTANSNDSGWRSVGSGWGGSTANSNNSGWRSVGSGWGGSTANSNDSGWSGGWGGSTANSNDSGWRSVGSGWGSWGGSAANSNNSGWRSVGSGWDGSTANSNDSGWRVQ